MRDLERKVGRVTYRYRVVDGEPQLRISVVSGTGVFKEPKVESSHTLVGPMAQLLWEAVEQWFGGLSRGVPITNMETAALAARHVRTDEQMWEHLDAVHREVKALRKDRRRWGVNPDVKQQDALVARMGAVLGRARTTVGLWRREVKELSGR